LGFQFVSGFLSKNFIAHNKIAITSRKIKAGAKREQSKAVFLFHDKTYQFFDKRNWEILDFFCLSSVNSSIFSIFGGKFCQIFFVTKLKKYLS
jgi:hypothetical protein